PSRTFSFDDLAATRDLDQSPDESAVSVWPGTEVPSVRPAEIERAAIERADNERAAIALPPPGERSIDRLAPVIPVVRITGGSAGEQASVWPPFDNGVVSLVETERFNLFGRLREEKHSLVALGMLTITKTVHGERPAAVVATGANSARPATPSVVDETRTGALSAERLRNLRADIVGSRTDVLNAVSFLEQMADDKGGAQVQRLLGEGYLRLGRSADAAEQFRLAMSHQVRQARGVG
ncbi:MAG: hypothetical protein WKF80_07500, partial [Thermomicrobiales bacterium]